MTWRISNRTRPIVSYVLPSIRDNFNYNQNKNDILPDFASLLVSSTLVKRTYNILQIGARHIITN
jgi:hypothetical protein